jgi:hypothetical protein
MKDGKKVNPKKLAVKHIITYEGQQVGGDKVKKKGKKRS